MTCSDATGYGPTRYATAPPMGRPWAGRMLYISACYRCRFNRGKHGWVHLLDENLPQPGLAEGVVLQVEAVKAMEGVLVRVHVQRVHIQVVPAPKRHCLKT